MPLKSIPIVANGKLSFLWLKLFCHICMLHFLYPPSSECLGCFHVLAIINNDAKNMEIHISFRVSVCISFGQNPEVVAFHFIEQVQHITCVLTRTLPAPSSLLH